MKFLIVLIACLAIVLAGKVSILSSQLCSTTFNLKLTSAD